MKRMGSLVRSGFPLPQVKPVNHQPHLTDWQNEVMNAFRSQTYVHDRIDVQPGFMWDSVTLKAGQTFPDSLRLFQVPQGGQDPFTGALKTYADTSMTAGGSLHSPEAFALRRVIFTFSKKSDETDIFSIVETMVWQFGMGRKMYLGSPMISLQQGELAKAPIRICQYCRSVYVNEAQCPGCGAREFKLSDVGGGMSGLAFYLEVGKGGEQVIENEEFFWVQFHGQPYTVRHPLKMWCHFEGLHARGIQ